MKYLKLFEHKEYIGDKRYWSINFQDPYVIYKASKLLNNEKKVNAIIQYKENNKDEDRILYITHELVTKWNMFDPTEIEYGFTYAGDVELTPEEKEIADMELDAKKYNL